MVFTEVVFCCDFFAIVVPFVLGFISDRCDYRAYEPLLAGVALSSRIRFFFSKTFITCVPRSCVYTERTEGASIIVSTDINHALQIVAYTARRQFIPTRTLWTSRDVETHRSIGGEERGL